MFDGVLQWQRGVDDWRFSNIWATIICPQIYLSHYDYACLYSAHLGNSITIFEQVQRIDRRKPSPKLRQIHRIFDLVCVETHLCLKQVGVCTIHWVDIKIHQPPPAHQKRQKNVRAKVGWCLIFSAHIQSMWHQTKLKWTFWLSQCNIFLQPFYKWLMWCFDLWPILNWLYHTVFFLFAVNNSLVFVVMLAKNLCEFVRNQVGTSNIHEISVYVHLKPVAHFVQLMIAQLSVLFFCRKTLLVLQVPSYFRGFWPKHKTGQ